MLATVFVACSQSPPLHTERYNPPPSLALVVLVDPSPNRIAGEIHQLQDVIRLNATPAEAVVVMLVQPSYGQSYTVRPGDSLSSIAAAHGMSLAALESANPQLGPLSGRNWKLIHPNEHVMIPNGAGQSSLLLVSKAPDGPPPPELVRLPHRPSNPTDYQRAQYNRAVDAGKATNDARIATWRAEADRIVQPWQESIVAQLTSKAANPVAGPRGPDEQMMSATVVAGLTTLNGLAGRRTLLILGGGEQGPGKLAPKSLANVNLVVANLADGKSATAWTDAATNAGAQSVSALDLALTQLQLAQAVNHN